MPLGLVALNADILAPGTAATVAAGEVEVRGYAFAGGERHVARVDVSIDGGAHWVQAELLDDLGRWAWRHWRTVLDLAPGEHEVLVRAWDSSAATQPEDEAALWNPKGYVNNARPRIRVTASLNARDGRPRPRARAPPRRRGSSGAKGSSRTSPPGAVQVATARPSAIAVARSCRRPGGRGARARARRRTRGRASRAGRGRTRAAGAAGARAGAARPPASARPRPRAAAIAAKAARASRSPSPDQAARSSGVAGPWPRR